MAPERQPWWRRLLRLPQPAPRAPEELIVDAPPTQDDIRRAKELSEKHGWEDVVKPR